MKRLRTFSRWWTWMALGTALGCGAPQQRSSASRALGSASPPPSSKREASPPSHPPDAAPSEGFPQPPPSVALAPPQLPPGWFAGNACDGTWHRPRGESEFECRCQLLAPEEKNARGVGQQELVQRMNELSPAIVDNENGLFESLGLSPPRCGEAKVAWRFTAIEPAKAVECRRLSGDGRVTDAHASVRGKLELELEPGHWESLLGTASEIERHPSPDQSLPPLFEFDSEPQGRLTIMLTFEYGRLEVLAHQPGNDWKKSAFLQPRVYKAGDFAKTFGMSLESWLGGMTVLSHSCVIPRGERPPPEALGPDESPPEWASDEINEPVPVDVKALSARLLERTERPCDAAGSLVKLEFTRFPFLAPAQLVGTVDILTDRRRSVWPTQPRPSGAGPAAWLHLGGNGADRIEVPVPQPLAKAAPCSAGKKIYFSANLAAVPAPGGVHTSIRAGWQLECADLGMHCIFEAFTKSPRQRPHSR